ncbi:glycoside hydrolase family 16 protein [Crateriforma spongiae]|nr:glycoside hydrolase family 16 protein [Crateriforma spongiae]
MNPHIPMELPPIMRCLTALLLLTLAATDASAEPWKLVWSDEFDVDGLPDESKWGYEVGFIRNEEAQYYTEARPENARVKDGVLIIEGRKEKYANPDYEPNSRSWQKSRSHAQYTAASVVTRHKANWTYGRIEVRAKLPQGTGVWPAIWMLGSNRSELGWPRCGEIDIMEFVGKEPQHVHGNAHFSVDGQHRSDHGKLATTEPYADFHVYAIEWDEDHIHFFFDDTQYHTFRIDKAGEGADNPFRKPQYLLINLALGGTWGGKIDDSIFPQQYLIDYVRVYQRKP